MPSNSKFSNHSHHNPKSWPARSFPEFSVHTHTHDYLVLLLFMSLARALTFRVRKRVTNRNINNSHGAFCDGTGAHGLLYRRRCRSRVERFENAIAATRFVPCVCVCAPTDFHTVRIIYFQKKKSIRNLTDIRFIIERVRESRQSYRRHRSVGQSAVRPFTLRRTLRARNRIAPVSPPPSQSPPPLRPPNRDGRENRRATENGRGHIETAGQSDQRHIRFDGKAQKVLGQRGRARRAVVVPGTVSVRFGRRFVATVVVLLRDRFAAGPTRRLHVGRRRRRRSGGRRGRRQDAAVRFAGIRVRRLNRNFHTEHT